MDSFELDIIDEKSRAGSEFMFRIARELQRVFLMEKTTRKITQQAIAEKLGTSRAVINRQLQGLENIGARRIGELLWAMGWEPHFEARRIPTGENQNPAPPVEKPKASAIDRMDERPAPATASAADAAYAAVPKLEDAYAQ